MRTSTTLPNNALSPPEAESDRFITQNLYQGAFCLCRGLKLVGKRFDGKKASVVFEGKAAQTTAMAFYNGAEVQAKAYSDAYRSLKDYIFER